jgi:hypothetical protein
MRNTGQMNSIHLTVPCHLLAVEDLRVISLDLDDLLEMSYMRPEEHRD